jgi:hypothetical protein
MGLDWVATAKADGTNPRTTLGMRQISRDDPETVEEFRKLWESHREGASDSNPRHKEYWTRPFETVLDEILAEEGGAPFIATKDTKIPEFCTGGSFAVDQSISWRGKRLNFVGLPAELVNAAYEDMTPDEMLVYADRLEAASLDSSAADMTPEEAEETVKEAVAWLRFWANHGHGLYAWS